VVTFLILLPLSPTYKTLLESIANEALTLVFQSNLASEPVPLTFSVSAELFLY